MGIDWNPATKVLWVAVERDDLAPDYMTSVKRDGLYDWPYSYRAQHVDKRIEPPRPDLAAKAIKLAYAHGSHTTSLGIAFVKDGRLGQSQGGALSDSTAGIAPSPSAIA